MNHRQGGMTCALLIGLAVTANADVFRWDNGQRIPGTEGITPGPGVQLRNRNLAYADLAKDNLTDSNFEHSNLTSANIANANLTGANFYSTTLSNADLTGAIVAGAALGEATSHGFTKEQLYSTASFQAKDLRGIELGFDDYPWEPTNLDGWDFSGQNLSGAQFGSSTLENADLTGANLTDAYLGNAKLKDAKLNGAIVTGARFNFAHGLTKEQLYSTASYQSKDLHGISFGPFSYGWFVFPSDLTGWHFGGQDLTNANLSGAKLTNADLTGAVVTGTNFSNSFSSTVSIITRQQLYSTASYQAKDLQRIWLSANVLTSWDFSGQNLSGAKFGSATLSNADLTGALVTGVDFGGTTSHGFTRQQLYATASYRAKNLQGIGLYENDLTGWDFSFQDLTGADLQYATFSSANLTGANLSSSNLSEATFTNANLAAVSLINARLFNTSFTGSDLTGADMRGTQGLNRAEAESRNAILSNGTIAGLQLTAGERMLVRDDDGVPNPSTIWWLSPRPPIAVSIQERVKMAEGSVLQLLIDADAWNSLISFSPGIAVQLDGALELTFADEVDVASQVGRTLRVFDWRGVSAIGQFDVRSQYVWDLSKLYMTGEVTLIEVPEPSSASIILVGAIVLATRRRFTIRITTT